MLIRVYYVAVAIFFLLVGYLSFGNAVEAQIESATTYNCISNALSNQGTPCQKE